MTNNNVEPIAVDHYSPDALCFGGGNRVIPVGSGFLVEAFPGGDIHHPKFVVANDLVTACRTMKTILSDND